MEDLHEQEMAMSRLLARIPGDDSCGSEHRDALRAQVLAARAGRRPDLFPAASEPISTRAPRIARRRLTRWIVAAAACVTAAALWFLLPGHPGTGRAFAAFAEALVTARSASYIQEQTVEGQGPTKCKVYTLPPDKIRMEQADGRIDIYDLVAGKMLNLIPANKQAFLTVSAQPPAGQERAQTEDFFEAMRDLLAKGDEAKSGTIPGIGQYELKPMGEKEIDGRRVIGFRYTFAKGEQSITLWGEPKTGVPVLVETVVSGAGHPRIELRLSHFELNPQLDPKLFDLTPPKDYQVETIDQNKPRPAPFTPLADDRADEKANSEPVKLELFVAETSPAPGLKAATMRQGAGERTIYLHAEPFLTQDEVANAKSGIDQSGSPAIEVTFTRDGAAKMGRATGDNVGKELAIAVNGTVVYAATIRARIYDQALVTGVSEALAKRLAKELSSRHRSEK